jgi:hypothetical protein
MDEQPEGPDLEAAHIEYITGGIPIDEVYETIRDVEEDPIGALEAVQQLVAEVARLKAAHGNLWIALADIIECPGSHPNATVRRMATYAEKALVHDTIAGVHPVPRFYKIEVNIKGNE